MDAAVLWTRRTRPQGLGKPHRTRFPTAPTRIIDFREKEEQNRTRQPAPHTKFRTLPPSDLTWSILAALQLRDIDPHVYHGVPKPIGQTVTSTYIEARNDLLAAGIVVVVLARNAAQDVSDDWSLDFFQQLIDDDVRLVLCFIESSLGQTAQLP